MSENLADKDDPIIGFIDECSPQTTANTQRLWSFTKPIVKKNTTNIRANTFGFYALNGGSAIAFKEDSKTDSFCEFLHEVRKRNPKRDIVIVLDNFRTHKAKKVQKTSEELCISLVYLPPYSPDLNPIEFIWKSIKRDISPVFIKTKEMFLELIQYAFYTFTQSLSFAKNWIDKFLADKFNLFCP